MGCTARSIEAAGFRAWPPRLACPAAALLAAACAATPHKEWSLPLRYAGSSTVGLFVADARGAWPGELQIDTSGESAGGERAAVDGSADLGGTARTPPAELLTGDVRATPIGRDAIAVVVHEGLPIEELSLAQLRSIFTGRTRNWSELGGPDVAIRPRIVAPGSATHQVFRNAVLGGEEYGGCEVVTPDADIPKVTAREPGAIGTISLAFLADGSSGVRALAIDGQTPTPANFDYPIYRPLYLLWRSGNAGARRFAEWAQSEEGQRVLMRRFVGWRVRASLRPADPGVAPGALVVRTLTEERRDGDVSYFPHLPYDVLTRDGALVRRVENRRGPFDERPERVELPPGVYLIRAEGPRGEPVEAYVTIEPGRELVVDVEKLAGR
jgi:phosphate transport system substrate-binding protein